MLESNPDQELSALGPVPDDVRAIVTRTLGDRPLTVAYADELLEALGEAGAIELPAAQPAEALPLPVAAAVPPPEPAPATPVVEAAPAVAPAATGLAAASGESTQPLFSEPLPAQPRSEVAQVFESRPPPSPIPPPMFDARPAPSGSPEPSVFDEQLEDEDQPDVEAQAQAIEAAFDVKETEPPSRLQQLARKLGSLLPPPAANVLSRRERGGSRRPDLDHLLDQPLDALDFEREQAQGPGPASAPPPGASPSVAAAPPPSAAGSAPAAAAADDFEILVDDEIFEIAEDDVELVDDEK